jgi:hypothetical protein
MFVLTVRSTGPGKLPTVAFDEPEQRRDLHRRESVAWPCGTGFERPDADPAELLDYARALDVEGPVRRVVEAVLSPTQCYITAGQTIKRCPHREMSAKAYERDADGTGRHDGLLMTCLPKIWTSSPEGLRISLADRQLRGGQACPTPQWPERLARVSVERVVPDLASRSLEEAPSASTATSSARAGYGPRLDRDSGRSAPTGFPGQPDDPR